MGKYVICPSSSPKTCPNGFTINPAYLGYVLSFWLWSCFTMDFIHLGMKCDKSHTITALKRLRQENHKLKVSLAT